MATVWTTVTVASVTAIGTTAKQTAAIAVAPNEVLAIDTTIGTHAADQIDITAQASNDGGTTWADIQAVSIPAGDVAPRALGPFILRQNVRLSFVATGSTDLPTATIRAQRGPMNGA